MKRLFGAVGVGTLLVGGGVVLLALLVLAFFLPDLLFQRGVRSAVETLTEGEATFDRVRLSDDGATIDGLSIRHQGRRVAYVRRVELFCDPAVLTTMRWSIDRAELHEVQLDVAEEGDGITLPPRTWALVFSPEEGLVPHTTIDRLEVHGLAFTGEGAGGSIDGELVWAAADGFEIDPGERAPLRFKAAEARDGKARWNQAPLGAVERLVFDPEGVLLGQGLEARTAVQANGLPQWPPLLVQFVPDWAGGRATTDPDAAERPWFGIEIDTWPWQPQRVELHGAVVVSDGKVALRPMVWHATDVEAKLGPMAAGGLPWSLDTTLFEGRLSGRGTVRRNGRVVGRLQARELQARHLDPYLALNLAKLGVSIREGTLSTDLDLELMRSWLSLQGTADLYKVRFDRTTALSAPSKWALSTASWLLGGHDKTFSTQVHVRGDFRTDGFSPLRQLFGQVSAGIVKDAGNRVGKAATNTVKGVGKVFKKIFRRGEGEEEVPEGEPVE